MSFGPNTSDYNTLHFEENKAVLLLFVDSGLPNTL